MTAARPMRILHTADWHLNDRLGMQHRQADIHDRLVEIAGYLDEQDVDILLVAGDIFSTYCRADALRDSLTEIDELFRPFLLRGGTIVALSGNHDHEATFAMLHAALDLASPLDRLSSGPRPRGRLYLAGRPTVLKLEGHGGQPVQFALLPYPRPERYLDEMPARPATPEERNRMLQTALVQRVRRMLADERLIDPRLPSVLSAHLHVRGSEVHSLYHVSEREDVVFEAGDLPLNWAYVALGHIHKPQALPGMPHARYSGSIERLDYAERDDRKGCVLVEVGPAGLVGEPVILPLDATPIYELIVRDPVADLAGLHERFPDRERALLRYELHWVPGEHDRDEICREIESSFPRWYRRDVRVAGTGGDNGAARDTLAGTLRDVRGTTTGWLEERLMGDADRDELLALALGYLDEVEVAE